MMRVLGLETVRGRFRILSLLLVLLPILTAALLFGLVVRGRLEAHERRRLERTAEQHEAVISTWMGRRLGDIRYLAATREARTRDLAALADTLRIFDETHEDFTGMVYVGPEGRTVIDTSGPAGQDVGDRAYFQAARHGASHVSDVIVSRSTGEAVVLFSVPVRTEGGAFAGLILGLVRLEFLSRFMERLAPPSESRITLMSRSGQLLIGEPDQTVPAELPRPLPAAYARVLDGDSLPPSYRNLRGEAVVGAVRSLHGGHWLLFAETPRSAVLSTELAFLGLVALGGLGVIVVLTPALIGLARSIERPLEEMARAAEEMEAGRYGVVCRPELVHGSPEEIRGLYGSFCSMAARLQDTVTRLEQASSTDALTGLPNRRALMDEGLRLAGVCQRGGGPCAVLMIDLDHFKQINDRLGHLAGDRILGHVAGLIRGAARSSDLVARFGGEEFLILAPNAGPQQVRALAERIRGRVEAHPCALESQTVLCTVSIGTAVVRTGRGDAREAFEDAIRRADAALYRAKDAGRNRVDSAD